MPIKHYFYFDKNVSKKMTGNKLDKENWEVLRANAVAGPFAFESTKEEYVKNIKRQETYKERARIIAKMLKNTNIKQIVSLGTGKGIIEYYLKLYLPEISIICTDYTEQSIKKLSEYTNCDSCKVFDMLNGNYNQFEKETCILAYRVSTGFSLGQWKRIMNNIYKSDVEKMIFVPTEVLTVGEVLQEIKIRVKNILIGKRTMMCGWKYTKFECGYLLTNSGRNRKTIKRAIAIDNTKIYELDLRNE